MDQIDRLAAGGDSQRARNRVRADPVEGRLLLVDHKARFRLIRLHIPVDIDHPRRLLENFLHLGRQLESRSIIRTVYLGHDSLQDRRTRRHLGHGNPCFVPLGDFGQTRTHPLGNVVALLLAFMAREQIDLKVGNRRPRAQKVVPHQAVEIERRRRARVNLHVAHFRLRQQRVRHLPRHRRGLLQRAVIRHVEDDLELALVVEGQHFHLHETKRNQREGPEQQNNDARQKSPAPFRVVDEVAHPLTVEQGESALLFTLPVVTLHFPGQQAPRRPRRDNKSDEQ